MSKKNSKFNLSKFIFSYDHLEKCRNGQKIQYIENEDEFLRLIPEKILLKKKINEDTKPTELELDIHQDLDRQSIIDTFKYMFYHIRLGIFVYIKDNKLKYFIPFKNPDYENNWDYKIKFKNNMTIDEYIKDKNRYLHKNDSVNKDLTKWSANNCLMGNWTDNEIGDTAWYELADMIYQTCKSHKVNDCIFFINKRDHPVLTTDKTEPYFHIFDNLSTPLTRHNYEKYVPILGFSKNDNFADILIPNYADWRNVTKKLFPTQCIDMEEDNINTNWESKITKALWRGSATGCGITPEDNQRINISVLAKKLSKDSSKSNLLDVGLVGKNMRDKKVKGKEVDFFRFKNYDLQYAQRIPMNTFSNYKYIIHIDGHVSAYRLGKELSLHSTILKVDSLYDYRLWFSNSLESNKHYLPIKKDLSNLIEVIEWCKKNDKKCKQISKNARKFYDKIINKNFILEYMAWTINSISTNFKI